MAAIAHNSIPVEIGRNALHASFAGSNVAAGAQADRARAAALAAACIAARFPGDPAIDLHVADTLRNEASAWSDARRENTPSGRALQLTPWPASPHDFPTKLRFGRGPIRPSIALKLQKENADG